MEPHCAILYCFQFKARSHFGVFSLQEGFVEEANVLTIHLNSYISCVLV